MLQVKHILRTINSVWVTWGCSITAPYFSVTDLLFAFRSFFHVLLGSDMDPISPAAAEAIKIKNGIIEAGSFTGGKIQGSTKQP